MDSAVVSVLMLSNSQQPVEPLNSVESLVQLLAVDKLKPLLKELSNKDSAKVKSRLPVPTLPAADQPLTMLETLKLTAPALTATTPPSLLPTRLPLLPEPLPTDLVVIASMVFVLVETVSALTATTPPSLLPTRLPLPLVLLKALVETSHLAIDSVPDTLITSVLNRPAPLLTAETPLLLTLTLSDLKDPPLLSLFVETEFSTELPSVEHLSPSAAATLSALTPTVEPPTAETLDSLANTNFLRLLMTETVPLLANTELLSSALLLSNNRLLMSVLLVSLVTATAILPETTVVFLRSVNPLSDKKPLPLLPPPALAMSNTDTLPTPTLVSTAEARLPMDTLEVVPMVTVPDMVNANGECEGTGTSEKIPNLSEKERLY